MRKISDVIEGEKETLCRLLGSTFIGGEIVFLQGYHPIVLNFSNASLFLWLYERDVLVLEWDTPKDCQATPYDFSEADELEDIQNALDEVKGLTLTDINILENLWGSSSKSSFWKVSGLEFVYDTKRLQIIEMGDETGARFTSTTLNDERRQNLCV